MPGQLKHVNVINEWMTLTWHVSSGYVYASAPYKWSGHSNDVLLTSYDTWQKIPTSEAMELVGNVFGSPFVGETWNYKIKQQKELERKKNKLANTSVDMEAQGERDANVLVPFLNLDNVNSNGAALGLGTLFYQLRTGSEGSLVDMDYVMGFTHVINNYRLPPPQLTEHKE